MKRILPLLIFTLIGTLRVWSQEQLFNIVFASNAPPHVAFLPAGGGALENNNSFSGIVYLDNTSPTSGQILELQNDNSFQTISAMNIVFAAYPPSMGGGGTAYDVEVNFLPVNNLQVQNLLAGKWYAEVVLSGNTYLGQFVAVPEPASATLLICGASLLLARCRLRRVA